MPKVTEEHRAERRRQIAEGARRAFARHGYEGATVEVLEREIGLSRGAIFSYYGSKLDLFVALAQEDQHRLLRLWIDEGWETVVTHIVHDDPEWIGVYLDASRLLRTDPTLRERWAQLNPELQSELERAFQERVDAGEIRADLSLDAVGRFLGIVFDGLAVQQAARFSSPIDAHATIELLRSALAPK
ncbi:MAG TPA: TetR/AcrR family transcriptional regulator [Gaiellaceae bacterium]|nr:TetR/AcrR family transcriptional regulator [Gaiellaceae bacterium]